MNVKDLLIGRSASTSNFPVDIEKDHEDIRQTWRSKAKKRPTLSGSVVYRFDGVKAFVPKEIKVENEDDIVTLPDSQYIESEDFELCGHMWSLRVYPHGIDEHSDCVAIRVQNKSPNMINAYYNISLKRSDSPTDDYRMNMWVDPELDKLCFRRVGHPDSNWGCDDFISF